VYGFQGAKCEVKRSLWNRTMPTLHRKLLGLVSEDRNNGDGPLQLFLYVSVGK